MDRYYRTERDRDRLTEKTHRWMDRDYRTERERERERERVSQSERQTDRDRDGYTDKQQAGRHRLPNRWSYRKMIDTQIDKITLTTFS